jgi:2,3-bisphosphoglycerate-independent phosphoglycerate mutase
MAGRDLTEAELRRGQGAAAAVNPAGQRMAVLFVFLDGLGLAPAGEQNPLGQVPMPHLARLLGGPLTLEGAVKRGGTDLVLRALDACLGIPGLPQSATGQTTLFTGVNAAALMGEHLTAYPTAPLREVIAEHSLLKRAAEAGKRVILANAHSERFWEMIRQRKRRLGASTLTALAAGVPIPTLADLAEGQAVLWDLTHEIASSYLQYDLPTLPAAEAGARLAQLAGQYDLVFFESFLPDLAGHGRIEPAWVLTRLDDFLSGILAHLLPATTLVLCSDHGNLEDTSTKLHTKNPVPLLAYGPGAGWFRAAEDLTHVAPAILRLLTETN